MDHFYRPTVRFALLAPLALALTGCVTEKVDGETTIFTFAWWLPLLILAGGVLAAVVGVLIRQNRYGWVLIIGGPIAAIFFAPSLWNDKVTLDQEHFTQRTGIWFMPQQHDIRFADLSGIDLISESRRTRRGRSTSLYMLCHRTTGEDAKIPINDLMKRGAAASILAEAAAHGVLINDQTGE